MLEVTRNYTEVTWLYRTQQPQFTSDASTKFIKKSLKFISFKKCKKKLLWNCTWPSSDTSSKYNRLQSGKKTEYLAWKYRQPPGRSTHTRMKSYIFIWTWSSVMPRNCTNVDDRGGTGRDPVQAEITSSRSTYIVCLRRQGQVGSSKFRERYFFAPFY